MDTLPVWGSKACGEYLIGAKDMMAVNGREMMPDMVFSPEKRGRVEENPTVREQP